MAKLSVKMQRFVLEFPKDGNAKQAAIRAGYSEHTAEQTGYKLLKHAKVSSAIAAELDAQKKRVRVELDEQLQELLRIAHSDIGDAFDEHQALKSFKDMPLELRRAVSSVKVQVQALEGVEIGRLVEVKLWDKLGALDKLMRHLGAYKDKLQVDPGPGWADLVAASMQKGAAA